VEYQDVSAEVEARLAAKEKKKQEKIEAKKRKRASTDSVGVTTQLHSDGHPIAERPKKRKKARIEENEQEHEQEQKAPSHGATTDMPSTDDVGTAAPVASPTTDPDIGANTKVDTEMNGQDGKKAKGGQKRAKRPKSGPDKANKRRKVAH